MTTTIPRADIQAVIERHGAPYSIEGDVSCVWVREVAEVARDVARVSVTPDKLLAEADDLDALADRYEREAAR